MVTCILQWCVFPEKRCPAKTRPRFFCPVGKRRNRCFCRAAKASAPVAFNPNRPAPAPFPMARIPNRVRMRPNHPAARAPNPSAPMPYPRASHPNVSRSGRYSNHFGRRWRRNFPRRRSLRSHFSLRNRSHFSLRRSGGRRRHHHRGRRRRSRIMHVNHAPLHATRQQTNHRNRTKQKHRLFHICKRTVTWFDVRKQVLFISSRTKNGCLFLPGKATHPQRDIYPKGTGVAK